jgi:hypothetical protein
MKTARSNANRKVNIVLFEDPFKCGCASQSEQRSEGSIKIRKKTLGVQTYEQYVYP